MNLLIVEPSPEGHHLQLYARLIALEAVARGWNISLLTSRGAVHHESFQNLREDISLDFPVYFTRFVRPARSTGSMALLLNQVSWFHAFRNAVTAIRAGEKPDMIYVVNLEYIDKVIGLLGSPFGQIPFCGMAMSIKFHRHAMGLGPRSRSDAIFSRLFSLMVRRSGIRRVAIVDECYLEYSAKHQSHLLERLHLVPDAGVVSTVTDQRVSRAKLGVPPDAFVVLVYGVLSKRKGIEQLVRAVCAETDTEITIVLAGTVDSEIEYYITHDALVASLVNRGQLHIFGGFVDDDVEAKVFGAADVVWVAYVDGFTGSSGVLLQACASGRPVVSSHVGLVGYRTRKYEIGLCVDPESCGEVSHALMTLRVDRQLYRSCSKNGLRLAELHTPVRFARAVANCIERAAASEQANIRSS